MSKIEIDTVVSIVKSSRSQKKRSGKSASREKGTTSADFRFGIDAMMRLRQLIQDELGGGRVSDVRGWMPTLPVRG